MGQIYLLPFSIMFDPMADLASGGSIADSDDSHDQPQAQSSDAPKRSSGGNGGGNRKFADELNSVTIHAAQRTFYIDLKESSNGKFFKVSEKSRGGQKTTIMFDAEDLDKFIEAFQEMKAYV